MALDLAQRRRKRLSMTSLIDVIFLLLLFFMLTSTFSKFGEIELSAAGQGAGGQADVQPHFLSLKPGGWFLNGVLVTAEDLPVSLADEGEAPEKLVLINLSEQTTSQELVDVLALLRGVAGVRSMVLQ